ncbi:MAG TPA: D-glycero-beta-D-manno-heptose 1,7-bisphosphate 7-phosphatase [Acidiphilium sp.]|nr:D-glycero-beta-D-manno-heptose 1,7-bisphosphate 7-phosphatase [Acidiphilium sp.]
MTAKLKPAVFLDRDGTLNAEKNYLHRFDDWQWIPGAVEAIRRINLQGYLAIVVTNQAGIARGFYTGDDVLHLHWQVDQQLAKFNARIDGYYFCSHHPEYGDNRDCPCRKPRPGMLLAAARGLCIDLGASFMIGDKTIDVEAGVRAGVTPILVLTGYGETERDKVSADITCATDVLHAVNLIAAGRPRPPGARAMAESSRIYS